MKSGTKGSTFWAKLDPEEPKQRLRFIISDPDSEGYILVVHATSYTGRRWQDRSCIIKLGEYSKITKDSFIYYKKAIDMTEMELVKSSMKGIIFLSKDKISQALLLKIQTGAKETEELPIKYTKYFAYF